MWRGATSRKPAYKYRNYRPQSPIYKLTCDTYKNKIQNRLRALVIKCVISHIDCIWNESANGTGWVWTDFVIQNLRALGLPFGDDKMFNFTKPFERKRLVVRKRICCHWSISTIICICTIAYEDYIIYSSVCVVYRRYYVAPSRISHI